jgi:molybdopterin-containing oxidoreductase family iron-sulfur binding subunit
MTPPPDPFDLAALRSRLAAGEAPATWRSLEELAGSPDFEERLAREFPQLASAWQPGMSRRRFLQLMGASLALAGVAACAPRAADKIVPYVRQPEDLVPGRPRFYATALTQGGYARGVLVESHEGRPTKLEGNPDHPASLGATDAIMQAAILGLYDPDRSQAILGQGAIATTSELETALTTAVRRAGPAGRLRILTEGVTSPTLARLLQAVLARFPGARWHQYGPVNRDQVLAGARLAFGQPLEPRYHLDRADVILALDSDFLADEPGSLAYARAFADARRVRARQPRMGRLYVAECTPGLAGAMADHRLALAPAELDALARAVARAVGVAAPGPELAKEAPWVAAVAADLLANRGRGLVLAGPHQPAHVHALAHAMNAALGNAGATVGYLPSPLATPEDQGASLAALAADIGAGAVDALLILGANPVYHAPGGLDFADLVARVPFTLHHGPYVDETAKVATWHVPATHELEAWGDALAFDGTPGIQQPLIAPLYHGVSAIELLSQLLGPGTPDAQAQVQATWRGRLPAGGFDATWHEAVRAGVIAGVAPAALLPAARPPALPPLPAPQGLVALFRPDPYLWDGRHANNGWLQELPRPLTKLTWDNAALVAPATAQRLGLASGELVALTLGGRHVQAPVWVLPGQPEDVVTLPLGYGREACGRVGGGVGFDAYRLRPAAAPWHAPGLVLARTGGRVALAVTQEHHAMEGRDLVRTRHPAEASRSAPPPEHAPLSLLPEWPQGQHRWAMCIDLNACIGCNACVAACQAENNIPVVGKDQVAAGREMHWLRVDRYYEGDPAAPETRFQPVPCMHCEKAPCELVCPTAATVHSDEGLNEMVYNRCIGTRDCSNNCPYKVRRFNFLQYADTRTEALKPLRNPDVTVRERGVMEKCTYCVQRINHARVDAEVEGRPIRDGELQTACQQACPTRAIVFGDLADAHSAVSQLKAEPQDYALLEDLNTRPRTTYLPRYHHPREGL